MQTKNQLGNYPSLDRGALDDDVSQWPSDADFFRMNVDTPIFYKLVNGQIKRYIKWSKQWVDSGITDWPKFCKENEVSGLRGWMADQVPVALSPAMCIHGYDAACLICRFGTQNGVRVWHGQRGGLNRG